ncbi:hypothetical protein COBT_002528, partial [Conglomerata obtusa]
AEKTRNTWREPTEMGSRASESSSNDISTENFEDVVKNNEKKNEELESKQVYRSFRYELENECIYFVAESNYGASLINEYIKFKDVENLSIRLKSKKLARVHEKIFIVIFRQDRTYFYVKGFSKLHFKSDDLESQSLSAEMYVFKNKINNFEFQLIDDQKVKFSDRLEINDFKNFNINSEGYFAFLYINNKTHKNENEVENIKELDRIRFLIYKSFAFYDGELISNFLDYSIYKFEEALSGIHWANNLYKNLLGTKIIIDGQEQILDFNIGLAFGPYSEYEEYKGGRRSFVGVALNKAARLAKLSNMHQICFCENVFNNCKKQINFLNIQTENIGFKKMKGFIADEKVFCIY